MIIHWDYNQTVTVITFEDDDLRDPEPLQKLIAEQIRKDHIHFLFDLSNVVYVSSSVLGLFITLYKNLQERNGSLKLVHVQPSVSSLFELTRLDKILEIFNDQKTALESFE